MGDRLFSVGLLEFFVSLPLACFISPAALNILAPALWAVPARYDPLAQVGLRT